jgi:hypothetical protein
MPEPLNIFLEAYGRLAQLLTVAICTSHALLVLLHVDPAAYRTAGAEAACQMMLICDGIWRCLHAAHGFAVLPT